MLNNAYKNYIFIIEYYFFIFSIKIINFIVIFVVGEDEGSGTDYEYLFGLSDTSEYDIRSSSSTSHYMDSNLSDSSVSLDYEVKF